jgi:OmcA/MtrC family decaheme c-type cytochrome
VSWHASQPIDFSILIHDIHYARVRGGYAEENNLVNPGTLSVLGFSNTLNDFSDVLFPQDIRNCTNCHADAGGTCSASAPCGVGQSCQGGTCVNTAWLNPSKRVCTSCHDEDAVFGHAALQTWIDPSGNPVETCETCHGPDAAFAVDKVHAIRDPYVPPYPREKP